MLETTFIHSQHLRKYAPTFLQDTHYTPCLLPSTYLPLHASPPFSTQTANMVSFTALSLVAAAAASSHLASAHPGEVHDHAAIARDIALGKSIAAAHKRSLAACADSPSARALQARAVARRADKAKALRAARGVVDDDGPFKTRRDLAALEAWGAVNHNYTGLLADTALASLFGTDSSCFLTPETTIGPYWIEGELIRSNLTDGYAGVPLHLELQVGPP